ncbi:MAG TPA: alpha/beta fold hydrolase [Candidatus Binatus sp.]|nr:alpha/beta fold hydrolase [Candidatus Binatus sp.]
MELGRHVPEDTHTEQSGPVTLNGRTRAGARAERTFQSERVLTASPAGTYLAPRECVTLALPAAVRTLLPALISRGLANGSLHTVWSRLVSLLPAATGERPATLTSAAEFDAAAPNPTPIVLIHGFLGDASHFRRLRRFLAARGFRNFVTFSYEPRLDYPELARQLRRVIDEVRDTTGAPGVDVIGHSLGGLVARHLLEMDPEAPIRRLVTLGAPCLGHSLPAEELAIFGAADVIIAAPPRLRGRTVLVPACGHLRLLHHPVVCRRVAAFLRASARKTETPMREAA